MIDEAEPEQGKADRWQDIMHTLRISTSGNARKFRGGVSGNPAQSRTARFSVLLASVNRPILEVAEQTRTFTVQLNRQGIDPFGPLLKRFEEALTYERCLGIRSYIIRNIPKIRKLIAVTEDALLDDDQYSDKPPRERLIMAVLTACAAFFCGGTDARVVTRSEEAVDNTYLPLDLILGHLVRDHLKNDLTLAEVMRRSVDPTMMWTDQEPYTQLAERYGLKLKDQELRIATAVPGLHKIFKGTQYENLDLAQYVSNLPGVKRATTENGRPAKARFAGTQRTYYILPPKTLEDIGFP